MNEIEAIEQLKFDKELAKRDYISPTNHEEYNLAILALEKQIPKKPIRVSNNRTDGCPECKTEYYEKFKYCPECGVKLDWSMEE